ncbi:unnamed protein product [Polarella glacialis]|uniref:C3H1-type domain-containing protein n=1 Tax=Polarella glacialis TaxID=89957 RepID=A0A813LBS2_POLGL|nr:unnamed protein product [Polarella glacialis]
MQNAKRQPESAAPLRYTTACFYFARGLCDRGASCTFAHRASDLRAKPDLSRTSLCRTFMKAGLCTEGSECKYAHGRAELRRPRKNVQEPGLVPFDTPAKPVNQTAWKKQIAVPVDTEDKLKKQTARKKQTVSLKPAKHQDMSAQREPMKESRHRVSSCSTFNDSNMEPSELFGNATGSEESGSCSAERDLDGAEFATAHGNNSGLPPLVVHTGFGHIMTVMTVKNTFLHFDEKVSAEMSPVRRLAKSSSTPQLVAA